MLKSKLKLGLLISNVLIGLVVFFYMTELSYCNPIKYVLIIYFSLSFALLGRYLGKKRDSSKKALTKLAIVLLCWALFAAIVYLIESLLSLSIEIQVWSFVGISLVGGFIALWVAIKENKLTSDKTFTEK